MDCMADVAYSAVIPCFNESGNIEELHSRLLPVLEGTGKEFEILFIENGSTDDSCAKLRELNRKDPRIKIVRFSRNFGYQMAITAGLLYARGRDVIVMDGDLQDPPEVIPDLIRKKQEGFDIVYGVRKKRIGNPLKRVCYYLFYRILNRLSDVKMPEDAGDFSIIDRKVVDFINSLPERNRFLRGLRAWSGFTHAGVNYTRDDRFAGDTKFRLFDLFAFALDGLSSFTNKPLTFTMYFGFLVSGLSFLGALVYFFLKIFGYIKAIGFATVFILILFMGGIQLIAIGLIGVFIGKIYNEVKMRPYFVISELVGVEKAPAVKDQA